MFARVITSTSTHLKASVIYVQGAFSAGFEAFDEFLEKLGEHAYKFAADSFEMWEFDGAEERNQVWLRVFPPRGYDHLTRTLYGRPIVEAVDGKRQYIKGYSSYVMDPLTSFATFVGLRPDLDEKDQEIGQTWKNIGLEFVGWKRPRPVWLKVVLAPLYILRNLAIVLLTLPLNIVKVVTELLPPYVLSFSVAVAGLAAWATLEGVRLSLSMAITSLSELISVVTSTFESLTSSLKQIISPKSSTLTVMLNILYIACIPILFLCNIAIVGLFCLGATAVVGVGVVAAGAVAVVAGAIAAAFALCSYVGPSVTSPYEAARETWAYWEDPQSGNPWLTLAIRLFFTGLRVLTTVTAYTAIVVFALPALIGLLTPLAPAALLPVSHVLGMVTAAVLHSLSSIIPAISLMPAQVSLLLLGAAVASAIVAVGAITYSLINSVMRWFDHEPKPADQLPRAGSTTQVLQGMHDSPAAPVVSASAASNTFAAADDDQQARRFEASASVLPDASLHQPAPPPVASGDVGAYSLSPPGMNLGLTDVD